MPNWPDLWKKGKLSTKDFAEGATWMRTRPDAVKALMRRFPPAALVRARPGLDLVCPAPGEVAIVTSYHDPSHDDPCEACEGAPDGLIGVRSEPTSSVIVDCRPEWLEVVGFYKDMDAERVKMILLD